MHVITDLPDDGQEHVDLPAAGVQGGGEPYQQHVAPRLLRGLERALVIKNCPQFSYTKYSAALHLR